MFTSICYWYIFSFGLSRRRHDPPFKPGGSAGALVGRPGVPSRICQNPGPGPRAGECGAACSSRKGPLDLQSSYHLIYSLARPPRCAAAPCSPAYCVSQRHSRWEEISFLKAGGFARGEGGRARQPGSRLQRTQKGPEPTRLWALESQRAHK